MQRFPFSVEFLIMNAATQRSGGVFKAEKLQELPSNKTCMNLSLAFGGLVGLISS